MTFASTSQQAVKTCKPCEDGVAKCTPQEIEEQLANLAGWRLNDGAQRIRRDWQVKDFMTGIELFNKVAQLAEQEGHHPDLHLEGYRHVWIELWTHALGGLSQRDFELAAKINGLGVP